MTERVPLRLSLFALMLAALLVLGLLMPTKARSELEEHLLGVIEEREREPHDDLVSEIELFLRSQSDE